MSPTVTILLPTYEPNPRFLKEALDSLVAQTYPHWQAVIHDDASTKHVGEMLAVFLQDPRFRFVRSEARLGIGGNWNACLPFVDTPYAQYLFQDDRWDPQYLERSVSILEAEPDVGWVVQNHAYVPEGNDIGHESLRLYQDLQTLKREHMKPGRTNHLAFLQWWVERGLMPNVLGEPPFVMLRSSLLERVGRFNESMNQGLDIEYWARCLLLSDFWYDPDERGTFRLHAQAATSKNAGRGAGLFDRIRCIELILQDSPSPAIRRSAEQGLVRYLRQGMRKFLNRTKHGKTIGKGGTWAVVKIAAKHPLLVLKSLLSKERRKETLY